MARTRLLIIDDDLDFLVIMKDLLRFQLKEVEIDTATSATAAFAHINRNEYDAIISDVRLPGMDGLTLTTKILEIQPATPILVVTAHGERDIGVQTMNSGAYAFIQKPLDRDYLIAWVRRALDVRRLTGAIEQHQRDLQKRADDLADANRALQKEIESREWTEKELRESEERFRLMVECVKEYAIFMLDMAGTVVSWNLGAETMYGYRSEEIIGHSFFRFYTEDDRGAGKPRRLLDTAANLRRVEDEGWRVRKNGFRFWANVVITALYNETGMLRGYAKITRNLTDRKQMEEEIHKQSKAR